MCCDCSFQHFTVLWVLISFMYPTPASWITLLFWIWSPAPKPCLYFWIIIYFLGGILIIGFVFGAFNRFILPYCVWTFACDLDFILDYIWCTGLPAFDHCLPDLCSIKTLIIPSWDWLIGDLISLLLQFCCGSTQSIILFVCAHSILSVHVHVFVGKKYFKKKESPKRLSCQ